MLRTPLLRLLSHTKVRPISRDLRVVSQALRTDAKTASGVEKVREKDLVAQWEVVRLGTENGFLSWCRNGYLCSVIAMTLAAQEGALCDELSVLALGLASYNMLMGTGGYIYNLHLQKAYVGTKRIPSLCYSAAAIGHLMLWGLIFTIYCCYDEEEIELSIVEDDKKGQ